MTKFLFNNKIFICLNERVGRKAYELSDVWKLGFHKFETSNGKIYRLCYLRTRHGTYYSQIEFEKENLICDG